MRQSDPRRGAAIAAGVLLAACVLMVRLPARAAAARAGAPLDTWAREQVVPGAALALAEDHADGAFEEQGAAVIASGSEARPALYDARTGAITRLPGAESTWSVLQVVARGHALVERRSADTGPREVFLWRGPDHAVKALPAPAGFAPEGKVSGVRLSRDGQFVAWAGSVREGERELPGVVLCEVDGPASRVVPLANAMTLTRARLVSVDTTAEHIVLADHAGSVLVLDLTGEILSQSAREAGSAARRVQVGAKGRAVWTVGGDAPVLEWSGDFGAGSLELPAGRMIGSVSFSPDGTRIAYTTWATEGPAELAVISAATGQAEVSGAVAGVLPRAAFLGAGRLAVSHSGDPSEGVNVLKVPVAQPL